MSVAIDFHSGVHQPYSSKYLLLCSAEEEIHTGLEQLKGE